MSPRHDSSRFVASVYWCVQQCTCMNSCVLQEELDLLPRLPPADFFAWANDVPHSNGDASSLPSISELVCNRGSSSALATPAGEADAAKESAVTTAHGQAPPLAPMPSTQQAGGSGGLGVETKSPPSMFRKARSAAVSEWETNTGGQVSTDADRVLHECRQAHGGHAVWTSYQCASICLPWCTASLPGSSPLRGDAGMAERWQRPCPRFAKDSQSMQCLRETLQGESPLLTRNAFLLCALL